MSWEAWYTLAVIVATIVVFVRGWLPPAGAMMGAMIAVLVPGVVTPEQALSGFANPAPITIAALFVLAAAVDKTGVLAPVVDGLMRGGTGRSGLARMTASTAAVSGFLNNTPIVAMLVPQIEAWCRTRGLSPSKYLMPLSFAAILGGALTLMGTATNIVASGLLRAAGEPELGFFEITWVGLPIAIVGVTVIVLLAPRVLPDRRSPSAAVEEGFREFVFDMKVLPGGSAEGRTVEDAGLRHLEGVFLIEIERDGETIAPVGPKTRLRGGDGVRFAGRATDVVDLMAMDGLASTEHDQVFELPIGEVRYYEAVIGADSPLIGVSVRQSGFRGRYQAAIVAVHRAGRRVDAKIGDVELRVGDTLLLIADNGFKARWENRRDFLLISPLRPAPPVATSKAPVVALVAAGVVIVTAVGWLPMVASSLLGAAILVLTRTIAPDEARRAVDLDVVVTIAAAFGLAAAIEQSGLGAALATWMVGVAEPGGQLALLAAVVLATIFLKEIITNKAAVLLLTPIAFSIAVETGGNPRSYAIAIAVAAALSFLTPIGFPTNTMVYGPGGYRYADYLRLGIPLTLVAFFGIMLVVPLRWPL